MPKTQTDTARQSLLRVVFDDQVLSFDLAADATLGEIARKLGRLPKRRYGRPIAVDVMLSDCNGMAARAEAAPYPGPTPCMDKRRPAASFAGPAGAGD
jgi:hypothetical protein